MPLDETTPVVRLVDTRGTVRISIAGHDAGLNLEPLRRETLTAADADRIAGSAPSGVIVRFRRASKEAKRLLREHGVAYASDDGEIFVLDPPTVAIHQSARSGRRVGETPPASSQPFALKASRVSRWLLLNTGRTTNPRRIARATHLSEGAVSQTIRALSDQLLVETVPDPEDARVKIVRVPAPARLLDEWERHWEARHVRELHWDVGTHDVADTLALLRASRQSTNSARSAVGGVAGAATIVRAVEPADVLLWVEERSISLWEDVLMPLGRGRGRGLLRLAIAPDDYVFETASDRGGIPVADSAQLCLDTSREGERALEANAAIRKEMGW